MKVSKKKSWEVLFMSPGSTVQLDHVSRSWSDVESYLQLRNMPRDSFKVWLVDCYNWILIVTKWKLDFNGNNSNTENDNHSNILMPRAIPGIFAPGLQWCAGACTCMARVKIFLLPISYLPAPCMFPTIFKHKLTLSLIQKIWQYWSMSSAAFIAYQHSMFDQKLCCKFV